MGECLFCDIVNGDAPAAVIHQTETYTAFLDANPVNTGHTLLVPNKHFTDLFDIDTAVLQDIAAASQVLGDAVETAVDADGLMLWQNNGGDTGQDIMHYHLHLIPRFVGDRFSKEVAPRSTRIQEEADPSRETLKTVANKIAQHLQ